MARNPVKILGLFFLIMAVSVYCGNRWLMGQVKAADDFRSFGMQQAIKNASRYYRESATDLKNGKTLEVVVPKAEEQKIKPIIYELPLDGLSFLK